jgi:FkbM family methyltransferase
MIGSVVYSSQPRPHAGFNRRTLPSYTLRWIIQLTGERWGARLLGRARRFLLNFETVVSYRGITLEVNTAEYLGSRVFFFDNYERMQETVFLELTAGKTVFDVGANIGVFTILAAASGASVFAFEPSSRIRQVLTNNVTRNGLGGRVSVIPDAVSDHDGSMPFFEAAAGNWGVGRVFSFDERPADSHDYTVCVHTIDTFVETLGRPDVIKMDIEGAEWLALQGARKTLAGPQAPQLFIEFHPREIEALGGSVDKCARLLTDYGYQQYQLANASRGSHLWLCFSKSPLREGLFRKSVAGVRPRVADTSQP